MSTISLIEPAFQPFPSSSTSQFTWKVDHRWDWEYSRTWNSILQMETTAFYIQIDSRWLIYNCSFKLLRMDRKLDMKIKMKILSYSLLFQFNPFGFNRSQDHFIITWQLNWVILGAESLPRQPNRQFQINNMMSIVKHCCVILML